MTPKRKIGRRSFLAQVGGVALAGGAMASISQRAGALQVSDSDPSDPAGRGRGTGVTDSDPTDRRGYGRGARPPNQGNRTYTGMTDSDSGAGGDPGGYGRGNRPSPTSRPQTGITDRDSGPNYDPIGRGRGGAPPTSSIEMDPAMRAERCQNNRARIADLERQQLEPEGWTPERFARATRQLSAVDAELTRALTQGGSGYAEQLAYYTQMDARMRPIAAEHGLAATVIRPDTLRVGLRARIERARNALPQRQQIERLIAESRNNLVALGCQ